MQYQQNQSLLLFLASFIPKINIHSIANSSQFPLVFLCSYSGIFNPKKIVFLKKEILSKKKKKKKLPYNFSVQTL